MDKYQEALNHVSAMGLTVEQIRFFFSGQKALNIEHLDWVLTLDKRAALEYLTPTKIEVVMADHPRKHKK